MSDLVEPFAKQQQAQAAHAEQAQKAIADAESRIVSWPDARSDITGRVAPAISEWRSQSWRESRRQTFEVRPPVRTLGIEIARMRLNRFIPYWHWLAILWRLLNFAKAVLTALVYIVRLVVRLLIIAAAVALVLGAIIAVGAVLIWLLGVVAGLFQQFINWLASRF
jgi:hypothetical protein